jgi:hypothetical protein
MEVVGQTGLDQFQWWLSILLSSLLQIKEQTYNLLMNTFIILIKKISMIHLGEWSVEILKAKEKKNNL